MNTIPDLISLRVNSPPAISIKIVTGIAAIVNQNSTSLVLTTITTNWMVKPRKKKTSNFRSAM